MHRVVYTRIFSKANQRLLTPIFAWSPIMNIWQSSKYTSVTPKWNFLVRIEKSSVVQSFYYFSLSFFVNLKNKNRYLSSIRIFKILKQIFQPFSSCNPHILSYTFTGRKNISGKHIFFILKTFNIKKFFPWCLF